MLPWGKLSATSIRSERNLGDDDVPNFEAHEVQKICLGQQPHDVHAQVLLSAWVGRVKSSAHGSDNALSISLRN